VFRVDDPGGALPVRPAGRLRSCSGCFGFPLPLSLSPREDGRGSGCVGGPGPPYLRAGPFTRALRPGGAAHPLQPPHVWWPRTVSYLTGRFPLVERAAARSGLGGGLALDRPSPRGWARRCPKLRETCVLSVWMRSVDDWPLAKILTRFLGVSCGP